MTGSSRPRLRSEISRGHSLDDPREGTSARTRPLSYDEIMRRRKSKKQKDDFLEEPQEIDNARNEESVKSLDHPSKDVNADDMKYSRDHAREAGSKKKEEKSSRLEDTRSLSKNKESHDSRSKQIYEKDLTNGREAVKTYRREHVSGKLDEVNQAVDSRSKHKHDRDVKNGTEVPKSVRGGYVSGRIDEGNRDMNAASKDKHENIVKNKAPLLKADRLEIVRHKMDDKNRDMDSRSKPEHAKYVKNDTRVLETDSVKNRASLLNAERRGNVQHKMDDENRDMDSRSIPEETKYVKNDTRVLESDSVKNRASLLNAGRRGNVQHKMDDENRDMDSRSIPEHTKYVKNDTRVLETDRRGHQSGRIDEEGHDMNVGSKDKHEKFVKYSTPPSKTDRRGNVQDKLDEESRDVESRSKNKHEKETRYIAEGLKSNRQGHLTSKQGEVLRDAVKYNIDDKRHRDCLAHSRYIERSGGASEIEKKRKNRSIDDAKYRPWDSIKKHDSGHRLGPDISERKMKIEVSHLRHDESSTKRRRSRSQERSKDKDRTHRRSRSASPKARKNILSREYDQGPLLSHPKKDDSGHRLGSDISEWEVSHLRHDESRTKRRRSRSQERSHDKNRRSRSASPKAGKNMLSREYDHGPLSSHPKKDDRGRRLGSDILEKKEKTELSHLRHDGGRTKRRRSRSRVRSNDKDRRSRSVSPKARKNTLSREYDHGPLSSHPEKDDSGHRLDSDISEKKEKMELSHLRHDESRTKRRSRSQERSNDKDRRSRSASPQARKNMLSREHDHDPLSSHSQKERSRPNDVDRGNMASNGANSHHRQHSGFSSGIGGYSPRKRKTDAAIKTPSPIRSPERKRAGRDLPSSGVDRSISASVASNSQPVSQTMSSNKVDLAIGTSVASSIGMPMSTTFFHGLSTFKDASIDSVQLTQATRPMRRLYIDNIPASASEKEIMESFNTHLLYSGSNHIRGTRPCISCMIHKEKGQALLEFLTPEDASAALSFDGRSLYGSMLKIRRPKDYVEMTSGSAERLKARAGRNNAISDIAASEVIKDVAISDIVKDSPHKIFVGGIGEGLSSEMIMEIFSVLGPLKGFRFNINEILNEPCVFLEYADQSIASKACAALNGMKLCGRILTVAQAIPDTSFKGNIETQPLYGIPEHVKPLLEKPTLVLKLRNVLDHKAMESLPEMDLEEILEDVRLECSRFGSVVSINAVTTIDLHTIDSKVQVVNEELPFEPREETKPRDHHMNIDLPNVAPKHDERGIKDGKPLTIAEEFNILDNVEGEKRDLVASPAIKVEASRMNTLDMKEADMAANGTQQSIVFDNSIIENTEIMNVSDGYHEEPIQGSEVSSITEPNKNTGVVKLDESETSHVDDVEQMDKATGKQQEVVSVSNDSASSNLRTEICDVGNIFEVGCILVEFKRTEASCMAAHYLQGRLFDDRIVTVEYVPLEAYQARFLK